MIDFVQVASSEWVLGVEIQNFDNIYNVQLGGDLAKYCCCDDGNKFSDNIMAFKSMYNCISECQTYFVVSLLDCPNDMTCPPIEIFNFSYNRPLDLSSLVFTLPFGQSTSNNQVSIKYYATIKENKLFMKVKYNSRSHMSVF